jgi:hypothetical protein
VLSIVFERRYREGGDDLGLLEEVKGKGNDLPLAGGAELSEIGEGK